VHLNLKLIVATPNVALGFVEIAALSNVMPLVALTADSDILRTSAAIKAVHEFISAPLFDTFV
jgi:hypothetical protein